MNSIWMDKQTISKIWIDHLNRSYKWIIWMETTDRETNSYLTLNNSQLHFTSRHCGFQANLLYKQSTLVFLKIKLKNYSSYFLIDFLEEENKKQTLLWRSSNRKLEVTPQLVHWFWTDLTKIKQTYTGLNSYNLHFKLNTFSVDITTKGLTNQMTVWPSGLRRQI